MRRPHLQNRISSTSQGQTPSHSICESDIAVKVWSPTASVLHLPFSWVFGGAVAVSSAAERCALWIGLVESLASIVIIHYQRKGKWSSVIRTVGVATTFFFFPFKAITVERTNSLDIHKISQRLTQFRLSMQKNIGHSYPSAPPEKNKLYYSLTAKTTTKTINQTVWDGCSWYIKPV